MTIQTFFEQLKQTSSIFPNLIKNLADEYKKRNKFPNIDFDKEFLSYFQQHIPFEKAANNSPLGNIQRNIDLDDEQIDNIIEQIQNNNLTNKPWNESVVNLAIEILKLSKDNLIKSSGGTEEIFKKADAGNSFTDLNNVVKPMTNLSNDNFKSIIGNSAEVLKALLNDKHIQKTNNITDEYPFISLLMPKNTRRVEIADLNRNFWVIGAITTLINNMLFKQDNNYQQVFSNMINEITQLWENLLYLWATTILTELLEETPLHVEFLYLPNNEFQNYRKFDNFAFNEKINNNWNLGNKDEEEKMLKSRLNFLKQKYPEYNICIIPIIRCNNYESNYYKEEIYECFYFIPAKSNNYHITYMAQFTNKINFPWRNSISIDNNCIAYKKDDAGNYYYISPFNKVSNVYEYNPTKYYAAARITPTLEYSYKNNIISIKGGKDKGLSIKVTDAIAKAANLSESFSMDIFLQNNLQYNFTTGIIETPESITIGEDGRERIKVSVYTNSHTIQMDTPKKFSFLNGFYLGECVSDYKNSQSISYDLVLKEIELEPFINSAVENTNFNGVSYPSIYTIQNNEEKINPIFSERASLENSGTIIERYTKDNQTEFQGTSYMTLNVGRHSIGWWGEGSTKTEFWNIKNDKLLLDSKTIPFTHHSGNLYKGAALVDPLNDKITSYSEYYWYTTGIPGIAPYVFKDSGFTYWMHNKNFTFIYTKNGEDLSSDNWIIRYVQFSGALTFDTQSAFQNTDNQTIKDFCINLNKWKFPLSATNDNTFICYQDSLKEYNSYSYEIENGALYTGGHSYFYPVISKVQTNIFYPNGNYDINIDVLTYNNQPIYLYNKEIDYTNQNYTDSNCPFKWKSIKTSDNYSNIISQLTDEKLNSPVSTNKYYWLGDFSNTLDFTKYQIDGKRKGQKTTKI